MKAKKPNAQSIEFILNFKKADLWKSRIEHNIISNAENKHRNCFAWNWKVSSFLYFFFWMRMNVIGIVCIVCWCARNRNLFTQHLLYEWWQYIYTTNIHFVIDKFIQFDWLSSHSNANPNIYKIILVYLVMLTIDRAEKKNGKYFVTFFGWKNHSQTQRIDSNVAFPFSLFEFYSMLNKRFIYLIASFLIAWNAHICVLKLWFTPYTSTYITISIPFRRCFYIWNLLMYSITKRNLSMAKKDEKKIDSILSLKLVIFVYFVCLNVFVPSCFSFHLRFSKKKFVFFRQIYTKTW